MLSLQVFDCFSVIAFQDKEQAMKSFKSMLVVVGLSVAVVMPSMALATEYCRVTDPTSTPLNVRKAPSNQGAIIDTIENETLVVISKYSKNKKWAYIKDKYTRENIGWVYREYLSCSPSLKNE